MNHSSRNPLLILACVILFGVTVFASAQSLDTLAIGNSSGLPGQGGYSFSIYLTNSTTIKGLVFNLNDSPDSLKITDVARTARSSGFRVDTISVDGAMKFMMIPVDGTSPLFPPDSGAILDITVKVDANAVGGTFATLSLDSVVVADANNQPINPVLVDGKFWFGQKGDVVYNAAVDLFDVLRMIDIAISRPPVPTEYEQWAGDINRDGIINVEDIGLAMDMAVSFSTTSSNPIASDASQTMGSVRIDMPSLPDDFSGSTELPVYIKSSAPVSGLQLVFDIDQQKYQIQPPKTTALAKNMRLVSKVAKNKLTLLLASTDGKMIPMGEGQILSLPITVKDRTVESEPVKIVNALAGTEKAAKLEAYFGQSTLDNSAVPESFALYQNSPNPFNMSTTIFYDVPNINSGEANITLAIYNTQGQLVRTLLNQKKQPGKYSASWNGTDESGHIISTGVYFYRLTTGNVVITKKLAVLK